MLNWLGWAANFLGWGEAGTVSPPAATVGGGDRGVNLLRVEPKQKPKLEPVWVTLRTRQRGQQVSGKVVVESELRLSTWASDWSESLARTEVESSLSLVTYQRQISSLEVTFGKLRERVAIKTTPASVRAKIVTTAPRHEARILVEVE